MRKGHFDEITVDMFAGAGGASSGIEVAGVRVDVAINHDPVAVSLHWRNHPHTEHHVQDVYTLSPHWVPPFSHRACFCQLSPSVALAGLSRCAFITSDTQHLI